MAYHENKIVGSNPADFCFRDNVQAASLVGFVIGHAKVSRKITFDTLRSCRLYAASANVKVLLGSAFCILTNKTST